jgi:hypothetical protein
MAAFSLKENPLGVSTRTYARQRGISHVAVWKAAKAGRIPLETDGTIDPAKADAAWDHTIDPVKSTTKPEKLRPVPETAIGSVRETLMEHGLPSGGNVTFVQARTAHEIAKAHLARLKLQERKGELVDRARASALVFRLAREERDAWANWPARTSALMAAALGVDAHAMQTLLETHVRAHLTELAEIKPEFR